MKNRITESISGLGSYEAIRKLVERCEARGWCRRTKELSPTRVLSVLADKQHGRNGK